MPRIENRLFEYQQESLTLKYIFFKLLLLQQRVSINVGAKVQDNITRNKSKFKDRVHFDRWSKFKRYCNIYKEHLINLLIYPKILRNSHRTIIIKIEKSIYKTLKKNYEDKWAGG